MMSSSSSSIHVPLGQAFHLVPARPSTSTSSSISMDATSSTQQQPHQVMTFFGSASMPALYTSAPIVIPKPLGAMRRASMSSSPTSSPPNRYLFATLPSSSSTVASTSPMSRSPISSPHSSPRSSPIPIPITNRKFNIKLQSQEPMTTSSSSSSSSSTTSHQIQAAPILIDDTSDAQTKTATPASPSLQEQVASLPAPNVDWVWRLTLAQLQTEMRERGLHVRGRKVECIHRLITDIRLKHFAGQSLAGASKTTAANRSASPKSITISETTSSPTQVTQPVEVEEAEPETTTTVSSPVAMATEQQEAEPKGSNAWRKRKREIESLKDKIEKQQGDAKIWLRRPLAPGGITDDEIVHWIRTTPKAGIRRIRLTYKIGYRKARRLLDRALQEAETERGLSSSSEADSLRSGSSDSDSETSESVSSSSSSSSRLSGSEGRKKPKLDDKNDSGEEEEGAKELCSMASWQQITEYGHLVDTLHLTPAEIQVKNILFPDNAIRVNTGRSGRKLPTWPSRPLPSVHIRNDVDTEMTSSDGELPEEPSAANGGIRSVLRERLALNAIKEPLHPMPRHSKPQPMEPSLGALGVGITKTWEALVQEKVNPGRRASSSSSSSDRRANLEISGSLLDALDPTVKSTVEREAGKFLEGFLGHMFAGVASQKKADEENKENTHKKSTNGVADAQTVLKIARELEELPTAVAKRVEQRLQPIYG